MQHEKSIEQFLRFWYQLFYTHALIVSKLWDMGVIVQHSGEAFAMNRIVMSLVHDLDEETQESYWSNLQDKILVSINQTMEQFMQDPTNLTEPLILFSREDVEKYSNPEDLFSSIEQFLQKSSGKNRFGSGVEPRGSEPGDQPGQESSSPGDVDDIRHNQETDDADT